MMDTRVGRLTVPPVSLPVFLVVFIMAIAPLYDHAIVPLARRATRNKIGITHLQRIGFGLVLSVVAMAVAAVVEAKRKWVTMQVVEAKRKRVARQRGVGDDAVAGDVTIMGVTLALGYYLSSVLVSMVNRPTRGGGRGGWLSGDSLNQYHLSHRVSLCLLSHRVARHRVVAM
ncbi:protein NRT1/ PTR FAMILY 4.6-like [Zingiber officinale]|uniref:protein NRT1/ PTR FAMILY 4.6-like n=1 Tax=Zingiber officinale TaxID=94328 RepID=UPI001C4C4E4B|nr:protein NRT1/ PTR FAMILY 4.6-like [Zingiber officinale]